MFDFSFSVPVRFQTAPTFLGCPKLDEKLKTIVKFRINRALYSGSVRKPNLPGDESVSLFLGFTINCSGLNFLVA